MGLRFAMAGPVFTQDMDMPSKSPAVVEKWNVEQHLQRQTF